LINSGNSDVFLVKYDPSGNVIWARSAGGSSSDNASGICVDNNSNIYVTGSYSSSSISFGSFTLAQIGIGDVFVTKYDSAGNVLWARRGGGTYPDYSRGICVDAIGNVYLTGAFGSNTIAFGTITLTNASSNHDDIFIVKYDSLGNVLWARSAGSANYDGPSSICSDASGNVLITGYFGSSSISFGSSTLTNAGGSCPLYCADFFIAKYDSSGNVLWAKGAGGTDMDAGVNLAPDPYGNVFVAGYYKSDTIAFDSNALFNAGYEDMFLAKYDGSGNVVWIKNVGGTLSDSPSGICSEANGNVFMTGYFTSDSLAFDNYFLNSAGKRDIFIAKYDSSGTVQWAQRAGNDSDDAGFAVTVNAGGNVYLTGSFFSPTIDFGNTILTNAGITDFFIAKMDYVTGIHELPGDLADIKIYPNPSESEFNICCRFSSKEKYQLGFMI
jgi:hypothetical protein